MADTICKVIARRIWDSRGWPTIEVDIITHDGSIGRGAAPSGASKGSHEAVEQRDCGTSLGGRDVKTSLSLVTEKIAPLLIGMPINDIEAIDRMLIELDGTAQKSHLGGNTLIAVSLASLNAGAQSINLPTWQYVSEIADTKPSLPLPEIQIFGGGAHANRCLDIQDCMVMIPAAKSYGEVLEITAEIYHAAGALLKKKGRLAGVADEGGWWPDFSSNEEALQLLCEAIEFAGECPGDRVVISLDIAATELYHNGVYELGRDGKVLDSSKFINLLGVWLDNYPIVSIEDPLAESDIEGMIQFTQRFGDRVQIVGDDFLATNAKLVGRAIRQKACNTVLLKPNQAGTVLETIETYKIARKNNWGTIISARSGETEDVTIAHLAVGLGCGQFKVGSFSRSERMAKWNECLRIEEQIGKSNFNASSPLHKTWWSERTHRSVFQVVDKRHNS